MAELISKVTELTIEKMCLVVGRKIRNVNFAMFFFPEAWWYKKKI